MGKEEVKHSKVAVPVSKYAKWIGKTPDHVVSLINQGKVDSIYKKSEWMVYLAPHRVTHYEERQK